VADPLTEFVNKTFGAKQKLPSQAVSEGLTALGVPQAKDDAQRILEAATGGLAGGGAIAKTAQLAGKGAQALKGYLDTIGKDLAGQMTSGLGSGAGSVGASQAATASGASPVVAQLAGLGGGIVGGGARPVGGAKSLSDGILAPNGKPSNLTPEQYKMVRTPEFKKQFGDWENDPANATKALDENGEPMVVYHGGPSGITELRASNMGTLGKGVYLAPNKADAEAWAKRSKDSKVYDAFIDARNPLILNDNTEAPEKLYKALGAETDDELMTALKKLGYDSVWAKNPGPSPWGQTNAEIMALDPKQVKLTSADPGLASTAKRPEKSSGEKNKALRLLSQE